MVRSPLNLTADADSHQPQKNKGAEIKQCKNTTGSNLAKAALKATTQGAGFRVSGFRGLGWV